MQRASFAAKGQHLTSPDQPPDQPREDRDRPSVELAQKLIDEGWRPYPFVVGGMCRDGTNRAAAFVKHEIWQAMRTLVEVGPD